MTNPARGTMIPGMNDPGVFLEDIYRRYHRPEYIHPDPLEIVRTFPSIEDREIAAVIAAAFSLGRVSSILAAVKDILKMLPSPRRDLLRAAAGDLREAAAGFVYRFYRGEHLSALLLGIKRCIEEFGSLEGAFAACMKPEDTTVVPGLKNFCALLGKYGEYCAGSLLASPEGKSACKRMFLFLRWMVRQDEIDPGGWNIDPAKLIVPVDTHMLRITQKLGFTRRKQADLKTAVEISGVFRLFSPEDPVKYDFSLTRMGIHPDVRLSSVVPQNIYEKPSPHKCGPCDARYAEE